MDYSTNIFYQLVMEYENIIMKIKDVYGTDYEHDIVFNSIFATSDKKINNENFKTLYCMNYTNPSLSNVEWISKVREFANFIRLVEKCYMYNNSEENQVYVDVDKKTSTTSLYIIPSNLDIKIRYSFQETVIDTPNKPSQLMNFINDEKDEDQKITLVQIDILREFGKQMKNEFKFICGSDIPFNDDTDRILFRSIRSITSELIKYCIRDIFNNINMIYNMLHYNITVEEVIHGRIRIRRP